MRGEHLAVHGDLDRVAADPLVRVAPPLVVVRDIRGAPGERELIEEKEQHSECHSTLGSRAIKKKETKEEDIEAGRELKKCRQLKTMKAGTNLRDHARNALHHARVHLHPLALLGLGGRPRLRLGVQGLGFRVQGSGFRVQGSGFRVQGSRLRVEG